jgi:hypothetical protein
MRRRWGCCWSRFAETCCTLSLAVVCHGLGLGGRGFRDRFHNGKPQQHERRCERGRGLNAGSAEGVARGGAKERRCQAPDRLDGGVAECEGARSVRVSLAGPGRQPSQDCEPSTKPELFQLCCCTHPKVIGLMWTHRVQRRAKSDLP